MESASRLESLVGSDDPSVYEVTTAGEGPQGSLPLTDEMLRDWPSGDLFGLSQNAGMGWTPAEVDRDPFLILSTQGGLRAPDGTPIALGYHTGHWEIGLLVQEAAEELRRLGVAPFAGMVSDPCDGRTQGTAGHDGQPALSQRRGDRLPPADPLAAAAQGGARRGDLRQGAAGHDAGPGRSRATCRA